MEQQVDEARTNERSAQAALAAAIQQATQARQAIGDTETLQAQLAGAEAAVALAERDLRNVTLHAPFDGLIVGLEIADGEYAAAGHPLFTLIKTDKWYAVGNFRETELPEIRIGDPATVWMMSDNSRPLKGTRKPGWGISPTMTGDRIYRRWSGRSIGVFLVAQRFPVRILLTAGTSRQRAEREYSAQIQLAFVDGGARDARTGIARSAVGAARDELDQTRNAAVKQVTDAYDALMTGLAEHAAAGTLREAARVAYDAALDAYRHGVGTYTDVANEETALTRAESQLEDAHANVLTAAAALAFATGSIMLREHDEGSSSALPEAADRQGIRRWMSDDWPSLAENYQRYSRRLRRHLRIRREPPSIKSRIASSARPVACASIHPSMARP